MTSRQYYSVRTGRLSVGSTLSLEELREFFFATYFGCEEQGFFQERLGINCVDGFQPGTVGDVEVYAFRLLRRKRLFPIWERKDDLSEDEIFDLVEFLYDHASQPVDEGHYHSHADCGYHYSRFIKGTAAEHFREEINGLLKDYDIGYELSASGEVLTLPGGSLEPLLQASMPGSAPTDVEERVDSAIRKFRRRHATHAEHRDAIRDLADVLEYLRPKLKRVLASKDEADLFEIANNFGIRHHTPKQRTDYDEAIWLSWIFYFYLATIHAATRLIEKSET